MEAIWPEASRRITGCVRGLGADAQTADDVSQEVAARALLYKIGFLDVDDFCRWACRVARNLYVDDLRSRRRLVGLLDVDDRADHSDVQHEVEQRVVLRRVVRAINEDLDPAERTAIVDGIKGTQQASRPDANRSNVRRHRARAKLFHLTQGIAALWALLRGGRRTAMVPVAAVTVGAFVLLPAITSLIDADGQQPGKRIPVERPDERDRGRWRLPRSEAAELDAVPVGFQQALPAPTGTDDEPPDSGWHEIADIPGDGPKIEGGDNPPEGLPEDCAAFHGDLCLARYPDSKRPPQLPIEPIPMVP